MKKVLITIIFLLSASGLYSQNDTLSYWNQTNGLEVTFDRPWEFARFEPAAPCYIKEVIVWFYGNGQAQVVLMGHNAGSFLPDVFAGTNAQKVMVVWNPVTITTSQGQATGIRFTINEPIWFTDNQFYVGVTTDEDCAMVYDKILHNPTCESSSGGTYNYAQYIDENGDWMISEYAYMVNVVVEYPEKRSPTFMWEKADFMNIPDDQNNQGIACADLDNDGYQDLMVHGTLYINAEAVVYVDYTDLKHLPDEAAASAFIDFDNDGDLDLLFLQSNMNQFENSTIYINDGKMRFNREILSIPQLKGLSGFSIADINNDGHPDLFVTQLWSEYPDSLENYFFLNDNGEDFVLQEGLCQTEIARRSRGCQFVDYDNDGDLDLYVTNYYLEADEFWQNNGDGTFTDIIDLKGIDQNMWVDTDDIEHEGHNHGTGVDWYDYDNDGDMDLLLPQFAHPRFLIYDHRGTTLYKNSGSPDYTFTDTYDDEKWESELGFTYEETHAGCAWGDINNDGLGDFVSTVFYGCRFADLYLQNKDGKFDNVSWEAGFNNNSTGIDAAWFDYNNDGKLDIAMGKDGNFKLYENQYETDNNYFFTKLRATSADKNKYAIGARVKVYAGSDVYTQDLDCGRGQRIQSPYLLHFGIGTNEQIDRVEVRWPGEIKYKAFGPFNANTTAELIEGEGKDTDLPPILISPENASTDLELPITLVWSNPTMFTAHKIEVAKDEMFEDLAVEEERDSQDTTYTIEYLDKGLTYFWRVSYGELVSEVWSFTVKEDLQPPSKVVLVAPFDEAVKQPLTIDFSWEMLEGADNYYFELSENSEFDGLINSETFDAETFAYNYGELDYETLYYWHVRASNEAGNGEWSDIWSFTTDGPDHVEILEGVPTQLYLGINYPNPVNDLLKFSFGIPNAGEVLIQIVSEDGKIIGTILNEYTAAGFHPFEYNCSELNSGAYFYRIISDKRSMSQKFIVE